MWLKEVRASISGTPTGRRAAETIFAWAASERGLRGGILN